MIACFSHMHYLNILFHKNDAHVLMTHLDLRAVNISSNQFIVNIFTHKWFCLVLLLIYFNLYLKNCEKSSLQFINFCNE